MDVLGEPDLEVAGLRGFVMTRERAAAYAEPLSALASMIEVDIPPETIVLEVSGLSGRPFTGKFLHSFFLVDADDRPVAMIGAHEEAPGDLVPEPAVTLVVVAVEPTRRRAGLGRALTVAAIDRSSELGFTELAVPDGSPVVLALTVRDVPERHWLVGFYERLGFVVRDRIDFHGDPLIRMHRRP